MHTLQDFEIELVSGGLEAGTPTPGLPRFYWED